ncbi:BTAD domain-containing putative transcriptional regulator [Archangium gephyra]|uniref:AfsR/SARP family transcriptional regulator n=1 Tax=Archangium gephyra TaxID=48 RepID=UPI0035D44168
MAPLTFRLLGPLVIEHNGGAVEVKRTKASALVAYLASNPHRHTRSHLVGLLWPEVDETRGLASLRNTLWELQRILGNGWLQTDRTGVQLSAEPAVWVDVAQFQRLLKDAGAQGRGAEPPLEVLAQAVELYRGRMLAGLTLPGCSAFDEWLSLTTERHHLMVTQALVRLSNTFISRGQWEEALPHAQRLVALDSTHEEAHRSLIKLYAWLGRWSDALRQYQLCVEVLRQELDVTPQAETSRLLEALKARELAPPPGVGAAGGSVPVKKEEQARPSVVLPSPATPLYGRASELAALVKRLEDPACRLLTLTGPGGIGKTRLALEAAHQLAGTWRDGVRFVPLAAMDEPKRLALTLLEALELSPSQAPPEVQLREHLRSRRMLLLLDSMEHLLEATPLLAELMAHAPGLELLVTSRERLNLRGEWLLPLDGLQRESMELFALLAGRVSASFQLGPDNEAAVARICQLVEGSPLGLELAAAWVPFFSPAELVTRLEQSLDFLAAPRDAPERHQSLRDTFLHSWRLLSAEEQGVLRRLSVFRGGIALEAAAEVAGASLATLTSLVHKSLVRRAASGRVELHGLLRQYAAEQLRALPEEHHQTHQRHARHFLGLLERLHPLLLGGTARQAEAMAAFGTEQEDLRAAARWAFQNGHWEVMDRGLEAFCLARELRGQPHQAFTGLVELTGFLRPVVDVKAPGPLRRLLGRVLVWQARFALNGADCPPATALARVEEGLLLLGEEGAREHVTLGLLTAGQLALRQGNVPTARWCFHGSLSLARANGDRRATALALSELSGVAALRGQPVQARRLLSRSLATFRVLGDERHVATCLGRLATLLHTRGELAQAASTLRQGLSLLEAAGLRLQAAPLRAQLAEVLLPLGAVQEARQLLEADLHLGRALGHPETVAQALHGLGLVAAHQGEGARARGLLEEALALRGQLSARRAYAESLQALGRLELSQGELPRARARLRAALQAATEVGSQPLILDVLCTLAELAPSSGGERLHRATRALLVHPLTSHATRQRAAALLPPQELPPVADFARPPLPQLVADMLAAVGMD